MHIYFLLYMCIYTSYMYKLKSVATKTKYNKRNLNQDIRNFYNETHGTLSDKRY